MFKKLASAGLLAGMAIAGLVLVAEIIRPGSVRENIGAPVSKGIATAMLWADPGFAEVVANIHHRNAAEAMCSQKHGTSSGYIHCMIGFDDAVDAGEEASLVSAQPPLSQKEKIFLAQAAVMLNQMQVELMKNELVLLKEKLDVLQAEQQILEGGITPPTEKQSLLEHFRQAAQP